MGRRHLLIETLVTLFEVPLEYDSFRNLAHQKVIYIMGEDISEDTVFPFGWGWGRVLLPHDVGVRGGLESGVMW